MGSCVSVRRDSDSAMKLKLSLGCKKKTDEFVIPSPVKDNQRPLSGPAFNSHLSSTPSLSSVAAFRDLGSKDETFFDTQPWLESDCDDDFYSVNGEFTPSRGNTPVHHHSISMGNSRVSKSLFEDGTPKSIPMTSPTNKKKKLAELFRDSSRGYADADGIFSRDQNLGNGKEDAQATTTPKFNLVSQNGKRTPNGDAKPGKERSVTSVHCCLPSLSSTCSHNGNKKKSTPAHCRG